MKAQINVRAACIVMVLRARPSLCIRVECVCRSDAWVGEFQRASSDLSTNDEAKKSANAIFQVCSSHNNQIYEKQISRVQCCNPLMQLRSIPVSVLCTLRISHPRMHVYDLVSK